MFQKTIVSLYNQLSSNGFGMKNIVCLFVLLTEVLLMSSCEKEKLSFPTVVSENKIDNSVFTNTKFDILKSKGKAETFEKLNKVKIDAAFGIGWYKLINNFNNGEKKLFSEVYATRINLDNKNNDDVGNIFLSHNKETVMLNKLRYSVNSNNKIKDYIFYEINNFSAGDFFSDSVCLSRNKDYTFIDSESYNTAEIPFIINGTYKFNLPGNSNYSSYNFSFDLGYESAKICFPLNNSKFYYSQDLNLKWEGTLGADSVILTIHAVSLCNKIKSEKSICKFLDSSRCTVDDFIEVHSNKVDFLNYVLPSDINQFNVSFSDISKIIVGKKCEWLIINIYASESELININGKNNLIELQYLDQIRLKIEK